MIKDLIAYNPGHFEALLAGHRIHNHVAMDANEVFRVENAVLILKWSGIVSHSVLISLSLTFQKQSKLKEINMVVKTHSIVGHE